MVEKQHSDQRIVEEQDMVHESVFYIIKEWCYRKKIETPGFPVDEELVRNCQLAHDTTLLGQQNLLKYSESFLLAKTQK